MTPYLWTLTLPLTGLAVAAHVRIRRAAAAHEQRFDRIEKQLEELKIKADQNKWESDKRHRRNEQALIQLRQRSGIA
jgi:hypothetical protein